VRHPYWFDVVVGSNLFGDILSDLGPSWSARSASRRRATSNPEANIRRCSSRVNTARRRTLPGAASPIHRPDLSGAMMLEHFGDDDAAAAVRAGDRVFLV